MREATRRRGTADPFVYLNFAAPFQRPICGYGVDNVKYLEEVAEKYDPAGAFQNLVPGGF